MPQIAYRVEGVPPRAMAACMPVPAQNPVASSFGLVKVFGAPGTLRVHSPRPQSTRGFGTLGVPNSTVPVDYPQPSGHAPDFILPSIYVAAPTPNYGREYGNPGPNDIPVPAISSHSPYAPASASAPGYATNPSVLQRVRARVASGFVTAWPRVSQVWPIFPGSGS